MWFDPKPVIQLNCLSAPRVPRPAGCHLDQHLGSRILMESILGLAARTKSEAGMEQRGVNVAQSRGLSGVT